MPNSLRKPIVFCYGCKIVPSVNYIKKNGCFPLAQTKRKENIYLYSFAPMLSSSITIHLSSKTILFLTRKRIILNRIRTNNGKSRFQYMSCIAS